MRAGLALGAALILLAGAPALAQTRTDGQKPPTTTSAPPPRTGSSQPTRTMPTMPAMPADPGMPASGSPSRAGPDYGPAGPGGTRTTRPRRSADPPPDTGSGDEIPYVDPPAAPGYESAADAPMKTAGGRPAPGAATHTATPPATPATPGVASSATGPAPAAPPVVATPAPTNDVAIVDAPAQPASNPNALWLALAGLAAMLAAAGLGLRHILTAPHLSFRVSMDHGVQSAPRFKGAEG